MENYHCNVEWNADYPGSDLMLVNNVQSWRDCAKLCTDTDLVGDKCTHWTWGASNYGSEFARLRCHLKSAARPVPDTRVKNIVSGKKCHGKHSLHIN